MQALNPPLQEQIQSNQRAQRELRELFEHDTGGETLAACRDFANWMAGSPGMSPEGSLWLLNALESEVS